MPVTSILLAPVGAGKTEFALDQLEQVLRQPGQPFPKVWALLAGSRQEDAFRQRLIERQGGRGTYFNIEFFSFYTLYAHLLNSIGQPQRELDGTARRRLLRDILRDLNEHKQLEVYGQIADKRGFVEVVARFTYELKQHLIEPDVFTAAGDAPKDHDLARIYDAYQETLRKHELIDREGEGWLALEAVNDHDWVGRDVRLLLVDGFDQFNPLQAQLLARLAGRAEQTLITLPHVPGRGNTVGRRFERVLAQLEAAFTAEGITPHIERVESLPGSDTNRPPALRHLIQHSFRAVPEAASTGDALVMIEAPDPVQEAVAVLRRAKALLLQGDCQPDDILIALRDWERYAGHFAALERRYDVPLALHQGEPLVNSPAVIALLNLLDLPDTDFRRRELLDVLRSPYFRIDGLDTEPVDLLERISQAQVITGGREAWLDAVRQSAVPQSRDDDDERDGFTIPPETAESLSTYLAAFFNRITPPDNQTAGTYVAWLQALIGPDNHHDPEDDERDDLNPDSSLHLLAQIRAIQDEDVTARDLVAVDALRRVFRSLFNTHTLFAALGRDTKVSWSEFLADFKAAVQYAAINEGRNRAGRVLVTTAVDARGLPHRHVLIPGLSEGVFPQPAAEDPLYLDSERKALAERGVKLATQAEQVADEGLFYELIGLARETLTLSRPAYQNGAPWPESYLWRTVRRVFSDADERIHAHRLRVGDVVDVSQAASLSETVLAVAGGLSEPESSGVYNWLLAHHHGLWGHIRQGRVIEQSRMSRAPYDRYSGRLADPELIAQAAAALGTERVWSASQFNEYGMCGFRFFAKRLLRLEAVEEPEAGMDVRQLGTLNHAILEETYARLGATPITPENLEQALAIFDTVADEQLADAPERYGFPTPPLWEKEKQVLKRRLKALVVADFSENSPLEKAFGAEPRLPYRQESQFQPDTGILELPVAAGVEPLKVRGFIDRMDRQRDAVIVVDYKTGSTEIPVSEMERGRNFQMMLYLLAAQYVLAGDTAPDAPRQVLGGAFWHIRTGRLSGKMQLDEAGMTAIEQAQGHLGRYIRAGREGDFTVHPNKLDKGKCAHYCDFSQFCRVSITHRYKREK
ncbi:MAG: PD-(D/E)XK nuclease family protein [Anaerolineaceae bacterium]|nr:PD-(D/E)XK nuclease family protein [Anaerolineaceae bacterium]